jgi:hypothetical protein
MSALRASKLRSSSRAMQYKCAFAKNSISFPGPEGAPWIRPNVFYIVFFAPFLLILLCFSVLATLQGVRVGPRPYWSETGSLVSAVFGPSQIVLFVDRNRVRCLGEEYGAGSIVIINRERKLYFVEEKGKAIRYPVAIGSAADEWQGIQTITATREPDLNILPLISKWNWMCSL